MTTNVTSLHQDDDQLQSRTLLQDVIYRFVRHRVGMLGASITLLLIVMAIFGPTLAPHPPNQMNFADQFSPPTLQYPLGTDDFGRDILSRIMYGARISLLVGAIAVGLAATVGTVLGRSEEHTSELQSRILHPNNA